MCSFAVDVLLFVFFFFKQKTAYEMRISDWSSDVCSSDLLARQRLIFEQRAGEQVEFVDMIGQHLARDLLAFFDEAADFGVDQLGGLLGHILRARDRKSVV